MAFDDFRHYVTFHSICYNIEKKENLNSNSQIYIQWAKDYFSDVTKSLDSMIDPEVGYYFTPHLLDLIKVDHKKKRFSKQDASKMKLKINSLIDKLDKMKEDPDKFYKTKDSKEVFDFFKKIVPYFDDGDDDKRFMISSPL
jgi:hypothetical protein